MLFAAVAVALAAALAFAAAAFATATALSTVAAALAVAAFLGKIFTVQTFEKLSLGRIAYSLDLA